MLSLFSNLHPKLNWQRCASGHGSEFIEAMIAAAHREPKWRQSGFRAVINRGRLPAENFEVGVLVVDAGRAEYLMTANRLELSTAEGRAVRPVGTP